MHGLVADCDSWSHTWQTNMTRCFRSESATLCLARAYDYDEVFRRDTRCVRVSVMPFARGMSRRRFSDACITSSLFGLREMLVYDDS